MQFEAILFFLKLFLNYTI